MKSLPFVLIIFSITATKTLVESTFQVKEVHDKCIAETGATEDDVANANKGMIPSHPEMKCYLRCVMINAGAFSDEGGVNVVNAMSSIPEELRSIIEPTIISCGTQPGSDPCDTAYQTQVCYQKTDPAHYFMI